jgi:hypothetical protein
MYMTSIRIVLLFCFIVVTNTTYAQPKEKKLVQFSGVVVSGDSLKPVPFSTIVVKKTKRGTMSDYFGFFSFVAHGGDTLIFSALGYKKARFIIPDSLTNNKYSLIQVLTNDTVLLKETVIYPWPTKEQFKAAFLNIRIPDDDMDRARRNLELAEMRERMEDVRMDGSMNFKNAMQQQTSRLYYAGQLPPNNLLNPIAWAQFIKAWQNGEFKRKTKTKG